MSINTDEIRAAIRRDVTTGVFASKVGHDALVASMDNLCAEIDRLRAELLKQYDKEAGAHNDAADRNAALAVDLHAATQRAEAAEHDAAEAHRLLDLEVRRSVSYRDLWHNERARKAAALAEARRLLEAVRDRGRTIDASRGEAVRFMRERDELYAEVQRLRASGQVVQAIADDLREGGSTVMTSPADVAAWLASVPRPDDVIAEQLTPQTMVLAEIARLEALNRDAYHQIDKARGERDALRGILDGLAPVLDHWAVSGAETALLRVWQTARATLAKLDEGES